MFVSQMPYQKPVEHSCFDYNAFIYAEEDGVNHFCLLDNNFNIFMLDGSAYCLLENECDARTIERLISYHIPGAQLVKAFKNDEYKLIFCPMPTDPF